MSKVLVTGAAGFIGGRLVERLLADGRDVRALARQDAALVRLRAAGAEAVKADLAFPESLPGAIDGVDIVFHLAGLTRARSSAEFFAVNLRDAENLLRACAAATTPPAVVHVSSLAAAGPAIGGLPRTEDQPPRPVSNYGRSKLAGEMAARAVAKELPITIVRPPIVLGPGDRTGLGLFQTIARSGLHLTPGLAPSRVSVIHVDDLAPALILAAEKGTRLPAPVANATDGLVDPTGGYFVASESAPTYAELGRMVGRAVGRRPWVIRFPAPIVWPVAAVTEAISRLRGRAPYVGIDKAREALAGDWICSVARAERDLGFAPAAPLAERLQQTADWYRAAGWL